MIEAKDVCLQYRDGTTALNHIDLQVGAGELVYITGPSGSGKTSLLKLFLGMELPTAGELTVLGRTVTKARNSDIRELRRSIGPVFQEFKLIPGRTAMENVMLGMRFLDMSSRQRKENAGSALATVGLESKALARVENLSWGERQRVAIARAVARKPVLILADEPTGNLDIDNALNIMALLTSFKDKNTTVVITTHATQLIECKKEGLRIHVHAGSIHCERLG